MKEADLKTKIKTVFSLAKNVDKILLLNTSSQDPNFIYMTDCRIQPRPARQNTGRCRGP